MCGKEWRGIRYHKKGHGKKIIVTPSSEDWKEERENLLRLILTKPTMALDALDSAYLAGLIAEREDAYMNGLQDGEANTYEAGGNT